MKKFFVVLLSMIAVGCGFFGKKEVLLSCDGQYIETFIIPVSDTAQVRLVKDEMSITFLSGKVHLDLKYCGKSQLDESVELYGLDCSNKTVGATEAKLNRKFGKLSLIYGADGRFYQPEYVCKEVQPVIK